MTPRQQLFRRSADRLRDVANELRAIANEKTTPTGIDADLLADLLVEPINYAEKAALGFEDSEDGGILHFPK